MMTPDISFTKLRTFYYAARYCSARKAAQALYVTEGAVSQQITDLERRLSRKLFMRLGRKTTLTSDGTSLFKLVAPLVERCENIISEFDLISGTLKGKIKIASWTGIVLSLLPEYVMQFKANYPECDILLYNVSNKDIISMVLSGDVDIGIGSINKLPPEIVGWELWRIKRCCIAPPGHSISKVEHLTLEELAKHSFILADRGGSGGIAQEALLRSLNPDLKVVMEAISWEVVIKYVKIGLGISIVPEIALHPEDKKSLFFKSMSESEERLGFSRYGILLRKNRYLVPGAQEFIKLLSPDLLHSLGDFIFSPI
ncbi:MAG: LysR family transcriptional regulator [Deltaproteobacteria bacterium]|nr:LysR family transcriptional regulator [Deltaproteobacteria bacterium]